jgi:hypothetical protein
VLEGNVMTTFDKRERASESKFALDEEEKFKAEIRRIKQLGLWAAGELGKSGADASAYAAAMIAVELDGAGVDGVIRKLAADLAPKGITTEQIWSKFEELTLPAG